jgi:SAM-dependent methyltransferase
MNDKVARRTRHLDLGCGTKPRNPYKRDELYGVDIRGSTDALGPEIRRANVSIEPVPFPDNHFDSVSAYDFLEHIPRVLQSTTGTRFPFVELMNEVWRVLLPSGRFYAYTPMFPHPSVFQDPTHVNILTRNSHIYFTRPELLARMYGFIGDFKVIRLLPAKAGEFEYEPTATPDLMRRYRLRRRERRNENSHFVWEFEAIKSDEQ